jgi:hypothetical protein
MSDKGIDLAVCQLLPFDTCLLYHRLEHFANMVRNPENLSGALPEESKNPGKSRLSCGSP